jgi:tRNA pseudouridine55 synthase
VARAELVDFSGAQARVVLTCSAGFYVRSFAHALGDLTGTGACLETLRRTRSGAFSLDAAIPLDALQDRGRVAAALVPLAALLRHLPDVRLSPEGRAHVGHGRELQEGDYVASEPLSAAMPADSAAPAWVRLLDGDGALVGLATPGSRPGSLHPSLVLI